jgi:trans-2,3-dihydro-3-hydroxyanthranilate isomerase
MPRRFHTLDVFTGHALAGNPLAVILDAEGLDDDRMQAIAREFNLSETVFVGPSSAGHRAALRIFTPGNELPFAGHPTVGTAVLLALLDQEGRPGRLDFVLEERVGLVPCAVEVLDAGRGRAEFVVPRTSQRLAGLPDRATLARALGLDEADIGLRGHEPGVYSAGVPFGFVPLRSREAVTRARPVGDAFARAFAAVHASDPAAYLYCAEPLDAANAFHARMFAPGFGIAEDPATGSAAAAFAGVIMGFEAPGNGEHAFVVEQGDAMGRPSRITLTLEVAEGRLSRARIGGESVLVSEGWLRV